MGVPNIKGCRIRCSIEIDTSSLTAAQISDIQGGTFDGTLVLAASSDLGFGYYRIPYGDFIVEACQRDHTSAQRREITAYSPTPWALSPCEETRLASWTGNSNDHVDVDPRDLVYANLGFWFPSLLAGAGYTKTAIKDFSDYQAEAITFSKTYTSTADGHTYTTEITGKAAPLDALSAGLYAIEFEGWETDAAWNHWLSIYSGSGAAPEPAIPQPGATIDNRLPRTYLQPYIGHDYLDQYGPGGSHNPNYYMPDAGCPAFLAKPPKGLLGIDSDFVGLMWDLTITHSKDGVQQSSESFFPAAALSVTLYKLTADAFPFPFRLTATNQVDVQPLIPGKSFNYCFINSYNPGELLSGWLELHAQNLCFGRDGVPRLTRIGRSYAGTISKDQYSAFWYDDDAEVEPIASVRYAWQADDDVAEGVWPAQPSGGSVYDMTNNALLLGLAGVTSDDVATLIEDLFAAELDLAVPIYGGVRAPETFPAFELVCHGIPHLEAGDLIRIKITSAPIGPFISSYALSQTIQGIQHLKTTVTATQGEPDEGG